MAGGPKNHIAWMKELDSAVNGYDDRGSCSDVAYDKNHREILGRHAANFPVGFRRIRTSNSCYLSVHSP